MSRPTICLTIAAVCAAGCGLRDPDPPSPESLERLRAQFLYDEAAAWMRDGRTRPAVRTAAESAGFVLDGSGRQGNQDVDGFTRSTATPTPRPLAGLTAIYEADSERLSSLTVTALAPELREHARVLTANAAVTETQTARSGKVAVYFLGAERLGPNQVLRSSIRVDRAASEVYSVMYVVSPE